MLTVAKYFSNLISYEQIISQKLAYERNYNQNLIDMKNIFGIGIMF
jgi:hypothetical protein